MSDAAMLSRLLEAENSSRGLLKQAEEAAARRVHEASVALQEESRARREAKLREIAAEEESFLHALEEEGKSRIAAFAESLDAVKVSYDAAGRELRKILGLPGLTGDKKD